MYQNYKHVLLGDKTKNAYHHDSTMKVSIKYTEINTRFGAIGVLFKDNPPKVQKIILKKQETHYSWKLSKNIHPTIKDLLDSIILFLQGEKVNFSARALWIPRISKEARAAGRLWNASLTWS